MITPRSFFFRLRVCGLFGILLYCMSSVTSYAVVGAFNFSNSGNETRYHQLTNELRCPKCQNQSIADSDALVAQDLRRAVFQQLHSGKSDQQIIDFMVHRYGDFILYRPPVNKVTLLLWFGPLLILFLGAFVVWRLIRYYRTLPFNDNNEAAE